VDNSLTFGRKFRVGGFPEPAIFFSLALTITRDGQLWLHQQIMT